MLIHVVKSGDTLWGIAREYGVTVQSLQLDNGLTAGESLVLGQALVVGLPWEGEGKREIEICGYAYPHVKQETLVAALQYITWLSIFSYGFKESGELIVPADEWMITLAYEHQAAPVLVLTSITENGSFSMERVSMLLRSRPMQDRVLDAVLAQMERKGYLALDLDFEYIPADDAARYADFAAYARERLRAAGYTLSIALAPKTAANQPGLLYEGHDYGALAAAADRLLLMTYEWGYTYGPPMAVAPIGPVRQVVRYARTETEGQKLLLGVPNYGYDWTLPYEKGQSRAVNIGNEAAVQLAVRQRAEIRYDEEAQSPYFHYRSEGKEHVVWFEDARSIRAKLNTMEEYGLLGLGYWSLMRPFRQNWAWIRGNYRVRKVVR